MLKVRNARKCPEYRLRGASFFKGEGKFSSKEARRWWDGIGKCWKKRKVNRGNVPTDGSFKHEDGDAAITQRS